MSSVRRRRSCAWTFTAVGVLSVAVAWHEAGAQSVRSLVNEGNDLYDKEKFEEAEGKYRRSIEKDQNRVEGHFNLGASLYKQKKFDEAVRASEMSTRKGTEESDRSAAFYNMGNALLKGGNLEGAITAYAEALKIRPDDMDAKYNLSYALRRLQQQQQQPRNQQQDRQQNQQQQNQQQQNQQENQEQDRQQENRQQQNQQENRTEQQGRQPQRTMAKQEAERILDVVKNNEKEIQKKLRVRQGVRTRTEKDW